MINGIKKYWSELLQIEIALAGALLITTVFAPCEAGMVCRHTTSVVFFLFLGMDGAALLSALAVRFAPNLKFFAIVTQISLFFITLVQMNSLGFCEDAAMQCNKTSVCIYTILCLIVGVLFLQMIIHNLMLTKAESTKSKDNESDKENT